MHKEGESLKTFIAAALMLVGCQGAPAHLNEPVRTEFYVGCLQGGWPVSGCDCVEAGAIENGAPTYVKPGDQVAGEAWSKIANASVPACREQTQQMVKEGLTPPSETKNDATKDSGAPLYPRGK